MSRILLLIFLLLPSSVHAFGITTMMATTPSKLSKIPNLGSNYYEDVRKQANDAVQSALKQGIKRIEIEFPVSPGRIDVSLGEFLDESRRWTREFIRPFTTKGKGLWLIFPDGKEATLAGNKWGGVNFRIMSIQTAIKLPADETCDLMVVVTPGYNIEEFLDLEKLNARGVPIIIVNGNLDRVRGGYYPRIFYPRLYAVKERYLKYFESIFYFKPLPGGFLYRKYPEAWQQILQYYDSSNNTTKGGKKKKEIVTSLVQTTVERPIYNDVLQALKKESFRLSKMWEEEEQQ